MWQELHAELSPKGLDIVTVALDTAGSDAVRPHVERARATHPSLIDAAHRLDELLGIVNVPSAVWIDEDGMIVRGPETAFSGPSKSGGGFKLPKELPADAPAAAREGFEIVKRLCVPKGYADAIRDWAAHGPESRFALSPDEVVARSRLRPPEVAEAAAAFELGQHLWRDGHGDEAVAWFRRAHELQPDNWTYKRQAWTFADPRQGATAQYDGDWMTDVKKIGPENYYEAIPELPA